MNIEYLLMAIFFFIVVGLPVISFVRSGFTHAAAKKQHEKSELLFQSMFPELQPHFHPSRVCDYVLERVERGPGFTGPTWDDPPGFSMAKRATIEPTPKGERTILQDASGNVLAEFLFSFGDKPPTIGMVRVGQGKFRVKQRGRKAPWASYWHPEREFDWRGTVGGWTFRTRVADEPIDSSDRGTRWSDGSSTSSSHSPTTAAAAAAAGVVAAGGTFDGGGASAAWQGGSDASGTSAAWDGASASGASESSTSY